jgi:hypothetical protein
VSARVWIAQCLCPQRHCILAAADEAAGESDARATILSPLRERVAMLIADRAINPRCGICGATAETWTYEVGRTRWATLVEAMPVLTSTEADMIATGAVFGEIQGGRKFDA